MNQQRSRRFRAAKENADKKKQIAEVRRKLGEDGVPLPPPRKQEEEFDSNCITPGTPFMVYSDVLVFIFIFIPFSHDYLLLCSFTSINESHTILRGKVFKLFCRMPMRQVRVNTKSWTI
jgi:hypothetical protein